MKTSIKVKKRCYNLYELRVAIVIELNWFVCVGTFFARCTIYEKVTKIMEIKKIMWNISCWRISGDKERDSSYLLICGR